MFDYDLVVVGGGAAGFVASKLANGLGKKVALIEKKKLGGDCTWFGCIPSKALIKSANIFHQTTRLGEFGLESKRSIKLNTNKVMAHVRAIVQADADGHPADSFRQEGIDVFFGGPEFLSNHCIKLSGKIMSSEKFVVCTGSHPFVPPIEGLKGIGYLTNETIFDLEALPKSMIFLGGGPIGVELSAALNRLGVEVTIVQRAGQILAREDGELVDRLVQTLQAEGVTILTNTQAVKFSKGKGKVVADIVGEQGPRQIEAEAVLVAVGRRPSINDLSLEEAGVEFDSKGIKVNKHLRTTAKNIYAAGDVVPPYLFSHISEYEAVLAVTNAFLPIKRKANYENVLWCTYTEPELAHAGLTEQQAREKYGDKVRVYRWEHKNVDRAKTDLEQNGLSKFVCDKKGRLLGIHILGHGAGELMHEAQFAKSIGQPFSKIASVIHAYPSYSDSVRQPAKKCYVERLQNNFFVKLFKKMKR